MEPYGSDIFTEPDADPDTLAHLGPLRPTAGVWEGNQGSDDHPTGPGSDMDGTSIEGGLRNEFVEHYELQPIDPQTNGPQLLYGLRYHVAIVKPGETTATARSDSQGILSIPFINATFRALSFRMRVTVHDDGTWSYEEDTVLQLPDRAEPFHHIDRNTLMRVAAPTPTPLARERV